MPFSAMSTKIVIILCIGHHYDHFYQFHDFSIFEFRENHYPEVVSETGSTVNSADSDQTAIRSRGYKTFFMLNSAEHEILMFISITI